MVAGEACARLWREGLVGEGPLELVEVMRADGDEGALAADVLVELVLEVDEAAVVRRIERDVAQDGADDERADKHGLRLDDLSKSSRRGLAREQGLRTGRRQDRSRLRKLRWAHAIF